MAGIIPATNPIKAANPEPNNMFDALMRLFPSCSATQNCLNLSAEISESIVGIDISVAVYEINIASEATIFFNKLVVPFYLFLVGKVVFLHPQK
jgi:hypothetical protein